MTTPPTTQARVESRRITAHAYRAAAAWTDAQDFTGWPLADQVTAVVCTLIQDPAGVVQLEDLHAALREPPTVTVALDLLARRRP